MILIPALDIIDGACVRLTEGDFSKQTSYAATPVDLAKRYEASGCTHLHLVDLDGAKAGSVQNLAILEAIARATSLSIDFSGGIRSTEAVQSALDAGADKIAVGSTAQRSPEVFRDWLNTFGPEHFILSADVRDRKVAVFGWQEQTELDLFTFIDAFQDQRLAAVTVTDISKDGRLAGPSLVLYRELKVRFPDLPLIASGGISSLADLAALQELEVAGAIIGKALLEGHISMEEIREFTCLQNESYPA